MGLYVEPTTDKTEWIKQNGEAYSGRSFKDCPKDKLPVVYLRQGFIALGVAYNESEFKRFIHGRPDGLWYQVSKELLRKVVPGAEKLEEFK